MSGVRLVSLFALSSILVTVGAAAMASGYRGPREVPMPAPRGAVERLAPAAAPSQVARRVVDVPSRRGHAAGVLTTPATGPAAAGVVIVHGAGGGSRTDHRALADSLAGAGLAVLVTDKDTRGYSFLRRDYPGLAEDVGLAARWLSKLPEIQGSVGLLGISEGGWVAPLAAERFDEEISWLVLLSAPVVTPNEQMAYIASRRLPAFLTRYTTTFLSGSDGVVDYASTDVRAAVRRADVPLLAVFGGRDPIVPITQAAARLDEASPSPVSVMVLPDAGHSPRPGAWTERVARWIRGGNPYLGVEGADLRRAGAPALPTPAWYLRMWAQLALSLLLTVLLLTARRGG